MSRALWFAAGAGAGVYAAFRARRAAEVLTVDGLRDRVGAAVVGARMIRDEMAQGMADAEPEVRERVDRAIAQRAAAAHPPELAAGDGARRTDPGGEQTSTSQTSQTSTTLTSEEHD
ncbi:MAG: hypothetical protein CMH83_22260 [Nocardioides sp.]|nr:hypothetical protein [Nocardioides sp.]